MGSANLNDRSQCGDRDSEIAVIVEDQDKIPSQMNGEYYEAGRFAATLRRQLWKEHLGLINDTGIDDVNEDMMPLPVPQIDYTETEEDRLVMDPLSEETLNLWYDTARTNTEAFRAVFHCVPDDTGSYNSSSMRTENMTKGSTSSHQLGRIQGILSVWWRHRHRPRLQPWHGRGWDYGKPQQN